MSGGWQGSSDEPGLKGWAGERTFEEMLFTSATTEATVSIFLSIESSRLSVFRMTANKPRSMPVALILPELSFSHFPGQRKGPTPSPPEPPSPPSPRPSLPPMLPPLLPPPPRSTPPRGGAASCCMFTPLDRPLDSFESLSADSGSLSCCMLTQFERIACARGSDDDGPCA